MMHTSSSWKLLIHLLRKDSYFLIGLIFKLVLSCFFASSYLSELFIPFLRTAIQGNFWNAYEIYSQINPIAFPYPPVMLYIMALPTYLASLLHDDTGIVSSLDIFLARLPLLMADISILFVLIKWLRNSTHIIKWYWLNPIVIYISYVHGQLDSIPTALLCLALYFLFLDRLWLFMILLALACASKFHVIMVVPLLLIYMLKTKKIAIIDVFKGSMIFSGLLLLLNLPFITQAAYMDMVYHNGEQEKIWVSTLNLFDQYQLILIPACYMIMLYLMIHFNFINRDILLLFLALSFGMVTFFIIPGPGWYMWNMPFLIYFIIRFQFRSRNTFVVLTIAYFLFFIIFQKSDIPFVGHYLCASWGTSANLYAFLARHHAPVDTCLQLAFTFLQISLLVLCASIFQIVLFKMRGHKIYHHPYLIGIGGDSATGKTTLSASLQNLFGKTNTLLLCGDDMHRWERGHEKWNELTHLNPQANWLHQDLAQLLDLKAGAKIFRRHYDHDTGKFTEKQTIHPNKVIVYEGLHPFYLRGSSQVYDLKIFLKPSEALRKYWKVKRDVHARGYNHEDVIDVIEKRMGDSLNYILNQEQDADLVFSIDHKKDIEMHRMSTLGVDFLLKISCSNAIYFEQLLSSLQLKTNLLMKHHMDHAKQEIMVQGTVEAAMLEEVAFDLGLDIESLTGSNPLWADDYLGLIQIFLLYQMIAELKRDGLFLKTTNAI